MATYDDHPSHPIAKPVLIVAAILLLLVVLSIGVYLTAPH